MGLFDRFKSNKIAHAAGILTIYKDLLNWVDDVLEVRRRDDIEFDRGELHAFCCVVTLSNYEAFYFFIRDNNHITKEFLNNYYAAVIELIAAEYGIDYDRAYKYLKNTASVYENLLEQAKNNQDWAIIVDEFVYRYTKQKGLGERRFMLANAIKSKCSVTLHYMKNNFI